MGRRRVIKLCKDCGRPTPNSRRAYCDRCRDLRREMGRIRATQAHKDAAGERRKEQTRTNQDLEREILEARRRAMDKFGWAGTGIPICQE